MTAPAPNPTPPAAPAPVVPATPAPAPAVPTPAPAPAAPAFDPTSPAAKAWADGERAKIAAEEGAKARTGSKDAARKELLAQLGLEVEKPEDAAAALASERSRIGAERVQMAVERASRGLADDELMAAYLAGKGRLTGLDPTAADFATKVKALIDAALVEKPSLKLAGAPAVPAIVPPGGQGPGSVVVPGAVPAPEKRSVNLQEAYAKHYAKPTQ